MSKTQPYTPDDRAARRLADNAHGNTPTADEDYAPLADDEVARATYADPKARYLNRDSGILAAKRDLHATTRSARQSADEPFAPVTERRAPVKK